MNTFQHKEDNVHLNYWSACMNKSRNELVYDWTGDLKSKLNEAINALHLCWKPLKSYFQKLFLIGGKIFDYFGVILKNIFKLYSHHNVHEKLL